MEKATGKTKDECLKEISKEQKKAENWATQMNNGLSSNNGFKGIMMLGNPAIFVIFAAILQMNNAEGANSWKIIILEATYLRIRSVSVKVICVPFLREKTLPYP